MVYINGVVASYVDCGGYKGSGLATDVSVSVPGEIRKYVFNGDTIRISVQSVGKVQHLGV